jgi:hypothetical protein
MQDLNKDKVKLNKAVIILNNELNINNLFTKSWMNIAHIYEINR